MNARMCARATGTKSGGNGPSAVRERFCTRLVQNRKRLSSRVPGIRLTLFGARSNADSFTLVETGIGVSAALDAGRASRWGLATDTSRSRQG